VPNSLFLTKAQYAADRLRAAILRGEIAPAERLRVDELAAQLQISATPVREALRGLEAEGLVVSSPHKGVRVTDFSDSDPTELYDLRVLLECFATARGADRLQPRDVATLRALGQQHREAAARGDFRAASDLNRQWHMHLYKRAQQKPYLVEAITRLWNVFPWPVIWYASGTDPQETDYHGEILDALEAREPGRAAELMRDHILAHKDYVLEQLARRRKSPRG